MQDYDEEATIKVYNLELFLKQRMCEECNKMYELHLYKEVAIMHNGNGEGVICDNEAVGADFDSLEYGFNIPLYLKDEKSSDGKTIRTYIAPSVSTTIPVKTLLEECEYQETTVAEFFDRRNYNNRCGQNFYNLIKTLGSYGISLKKTSAE